MTDVCKTRFAFYKNLPVAGLISIEQQGSFIVYARNPPSAVVVFSVKIRSHDTRSNSFKFTCIGCITTVIHLAIKKKKQYNFDYLPAVV